MKVIFSALALVLALALPAEAQLTLQISDGRVTLDAVNVPARQILAEWARIGGTKIVGAEKIAGAPLTLKLVDMPERQALDIILRNVAGFMAAPRLASATPGASAYDRILIMATSSVPVQAATAPRPGAPGVPNFGPGMNGRQLRVPGRPPDLPPNAGDEPAEDDQEAQVVEDDQADTGMNQQPVFTFPGQQQPGYVPPGTVAPGIVPPGGMPQQANPVFVPMQGGGINGAPPGTVTAPVITLQPGANGPTIYNFVPADPNNPQVAVPPQTTPTRGFGVVGAPVPGVIQAPPQPVQPGQPVRPPRQQQ
jgi:hypothetical protein